MSVKQPIKRATFRFIKAYITALVILSSYWWLTLKSKLFGEIYKEERIDAIHQKNAKRIEKTILELQGLFIKVGQLFSIMTNFLPETFRTGLENLQDAVPSKPYEQIETQIRQELGDTPDKVFASFNKEPVASASLGQVHTAVTHQGQKVAVKVRHLGVEKMARADLRTIWRILRMVQRFVKVRGLYNYYHEIKAMILDELDFTKESANITQITANFKDNEDMIFPEVVSELSTQRILTLSYLEGTKITDTQRLRELGLNPSKLGESLLTAYCQMIFIDGIYHADPHPGNIRVTDKGKIILLDFGAVGHLAPSMRTGLGSFLEAIIKGDEEQLLHSLKTMGFLRIGTDQTDAATKVIEHFHRKFQDEIRLTDFSLSSIKVDTSKGFEHLSDLHEMNLGIREISSAFHMPREWVLLERTALLLTGICTHLDPEMNPAMTIRPYLEEFVLGTDKDWSGMLFDLTREKILSFLSLPKLFEKFISRAILGKLTVRIDGIQSAANLIYLGTQQLTFAILASVCAGIGIYFHHVKNPYYSQYSFYGTGGFIILMLIAMLRSKRHKK